MVALQGCGGVENKNIRNIFIDWNPKCHNFRIRILDKTRKYIVDFLTLSLRFALHMRNNWPNMR